MIMSYRLQLHTKKIVLSCVSLVLLASATPIAAQSAKRMFGKDAPFNLSQLPQQSRLKRALDALPANTRQQALNNLHGFTFPEDDTQSMSADANGSIYYVDSALPPPASTAGAISTSSSISTALPVVNVFTLHSKPGASKIVFLDFDGHTISGTQWNTTYGVSTYQAKAFDSDGNPGSFSAAEQNTIQEVWHRIAEDYAPFDIDVTTEQPLSFGPTVGRILFTPSTDSNNIAMPSNSSGGIAYVNVWGLSNYATSYSPALVYTTNLGPNYAPYLAEAGAHEFGHNLGLTHDGVTDATKNPICGITEYFCGLGSGLVSWSPIMGAGYYSNVTQWSKGEYPYANNTAQDDVAILASKLGFRVDDSGNTFSTASALIIDSSGTISATTPQNDPYNTLPANKGIIAGNSDLDVYGFDSGAGSVNLIFTPAWAAFPRSGGYQDYRGANLDIQATLYNSAGIVVASSEPNTDTGASISATLAAGHYYVSINGVGNSVSPYSAYNSMGEYFITGTLTSPISADTTAPNPNPMSFAVAPYASSSTQLGMVATTATDPSGPVQYQFQCVSGGAGCVSSPWQTSTSYTATGLSANTSYSFSVIAKDALGNITQASPSVMATTLSAIPLAPSALSGTALKGKSIKLSWKDNSTNETAFVLERSVNSGAWAVKATLASNTQTYTDSGLTVGAKYTYRVKATNAAGSSAYSNSTAAITAIK